MPEEDILHQEDVEEVIRETIEEEADAQIEDFIDAASDQAAIVDLPAPSAAYVEAEAIAITDRLNLVTQVLRDLGAIPSA